MPAEVHRLYESLKSDQPIKLFIADDPDPVLVPEWALTSISSKFTTAIRHCKYPMSTTYFNGEFGVLRFPRDNLDAWKVLLFWITNRTLVNPLE
ncbi:hypothetical protein LTR37_007468 [Vermiconidia calcicola]|uniref:Uncharacterized protein n=1 Tax=Vermiconidia calcicola TaxID=1690605 RepID=A0ACC3NDW1_9PEZI|nr:hypothetical protein LTR37_007468 [Vermiconidia calcicola]